MTARPLGMTLAAAMIGVMGLAPMAHARTVSDDEMGTRGPAVPRVMNLHGAYERALGHVRAGRIGGIAWAIWRRPRLPARLAPAKATTCPMSAEPNCPLIYNGGPVEHHPRLFLLLWGPAWQTNAGEKATAHYIERFYAGLGVRPADNWSTITSQYRDSAGFPAFTGAVFAGTFNDTSKPPSGTTNDQFAAEASAFASGHHLRTGLTDDQIIIATQSGICTYNFAGCPSPGPWCAYHSSVNGNGVTFTSLPYVLDAGASCGQGIVTNGQNSNYDGFSILGGHEFAEAVTDPYVGTGWIDGSDTASGGEIGDKCEWVDPVTFNNDIGLVKLSSGTFAMQPLFSNGNFAAHKQSCPLAATPDTVTLTNPGNQQGPVWSSVSLQVKATSATGATLSYAATGLPPGLSIASSTGRINGLPAAGTATVHLAATDTTGAYAPAVLTWTVTPATGAVKGDHGLCVDAQGSQTADGTPIVIWSCDSSAGEQWTTGAAVSLRYGGKCLTDPQNGRAGTGMVLAGCHGSANQRLVYQRNGEYVLTANGLCLTDPLGATANGTQLKITACHDAANQRWSIPGGTTVP